MRKTIWFDMDGTLYDLYKIPGWLGLLESRRWNDAFGQADYARAHIDRIREAIKALKATGWTVGIITWAPMGIQWWDEALGEVERVKCKWVDQNIPELADDDIPFACLPYGESKAKFIIDMEEAGDVNYLVDDNKEVRRDWRDHTGGNGVFKTINASRSYHRELEGLAM